MAIKINLQETETELFCSSKWWGDPDLPADMEYPTIQVTEEPHHPGDGGWGNLRLPPHLRVSDRL